MKVGRYDYPSQFEDIRQLTDELQSMLLRGNYVLSGELKAFEKAFGQYLGCGYAVGVNTGTDSLVLALRALDIQASDEVITQANTFNATVAAIKLAGACPVLVDADPESFLIDETQAAVAITSRTRVLMPVHLYGKLTPMDSLLQLAAKAGVHIVEDAAQAHGARRNGKAAGTFGIMGCFSFHPSKNLAAAGDAGAVVTNSQELAALMECDRDLGQKGQNKHVRLGMNSKMDAIQARILSWKLPQLDRWNESRRKVATWYRDRLSGLPVGFQSLSPGEEHVYHLFTIRTKVRDELLGYLQQHGVDAVVRYPSAIHLQPAFQNLGWRKGQFPVAERLAEELLCLPIRPNLTESDVDYVARCVRSFFSGGAAK